jgi:hypothetical protein
MFEAKGNDRNRQPLATCIQCIALAQDVTQLACLERARINNEVGLFPESSQPFPFFRNSLADTSVERQWMDRVSL